MLDKNSTCHMTLHYDYEGMHLMKIVLYYAVKPSRKHGGFFLGFLFRSQSMSRQNCQP